MRNLKKLLAVIVTVVMIVTLSIPAFAADTAATTKTDVEICTDLGMIQGSGAGVTDAYLATQPTRLQGAIMFLRLKGMEESALSYDGTDNFVDVDALNADNQAITAFLYNFPEYGFEGVGNDKFDPMGLMTAKAYYKILLIALGYTYSDTDATADFSWKTVMAKASAVGLTKLLDNDAFTIKDLATGTVEALKAKVKGSDQTLVAVLAEDSGYFADIAEADGLFEKAVVPDEPLAISSVAALNYREIVVTFNKEVDASKLGTAGNYAVANKTISSVSAAADNLSATILLADNTPIAVGATADVTVKAAILGADTTKTTAAVTDGTLPSLVSAQASGNSGITLTFSEPVRTVGVPTDYKLDGLFFAQSAFPTASGRTVTIKPTSRMLAGEHEITVSSTITDFAGYGLTATRAMKFTVAADSTAPTVSFVSATQKQVVVKFSEAVDSTTAQNGAITFTNGVTKNGAATLASDGVTLTIAVNGIIPATGTTKITIPKASVVDMFGNSPAADLTLDFIGVADTTRPEVKGVAFKAGSQTVLVVEYSKNVDKTTGTYTLVETKSDGTIANPAPVPTVDYDVDSNNQPVKTKIALTLAAKYEPTSTYSLLITGVTDLDNPLANKVVDYAVSGLKVTDLTAPAFSSIKVSGQGMYIAFDSAIDASTVTAANFTYVRSDNNKVVSGIPSGATVALMNSSTIKITYKTAGEDATNGLDPQNIQQIQWVNLKGADGNAIAADVKVRPGAAWVTPAAQPELDTATVTGPNTIVATLKAAGNDLVFNAAQAIGDFQLNKSGVPATKYNLINAVYDSANKKITFTTYETIAPDGKVASNGDALDLTVKGTTTLTDVFGQALKANTVAIVSDSYVPTATFTSAASATGVVTVTLSEKMQTKGGTAIDGNYKAGAQFVIVVDGATKAFTVVGAADQKTLTFTVTGGFASGKSVSVKYFADPAAANTNYLQDLSNNNLANFDLSGTSN